MIKKILILIASIGWLVPAWLGFSSIDSWLVAELNPASPVNSFPHYPFGKQALLLSGVWFSLVIVAWGLYLTFFKDSSESAE